jgi:hypothetical protein
MPPARRSSTTKSTTRPARGVRARAAATSSATRREVEQSIARFEKRLDDANDALQTLGKHLGRGAQSSYKEVTSALRALRRDAAKTNKAALKDFDKLRAALTPSSVSGRSSRTTRAASAPARSTARGTGSRTTSRSTGARSTASRTTTSRSTGSRSGASGASGASRATGSRATGSRSTGSRSTGGRSKGSSS